MQIRIEDDKYKKGAKTFASVRAEKGRGEGCLCVRKENGENVKCAHLEPNDRYFENLKGDRENKINMMQVRAAKEAYAMLVEKRGPFAQEDGVCREAMINYAVCVANDSAMGVSRCPHRKTAKLMNWYRYRYTIVTKEGAGPPKEALFESWGYETVLPEIIGFDRELNNTGIGGASVELIAERLLERGRIENYEFIAEEKLPIPMESLYP